MSDLQGAAPVAAPVRTKYDYSKLNTLAVVSLATSLTGFGVVAGIITGHISLAQIQQTHEHGRALAIAGLVIGYASIALWVLSTVFWVGLALTGLSQIGPGGMMDENWWRNWQNWGPMMDND